MNLTERSLASTVYEEMRSSSRILVKNMPVGVTKGEVYAIFNEFGPVKYINLELFSDNSCAEVEFESLSAALKAHEGLQNFAYNGFLLQVEFSGIKPDKACNVSDLQRLSAPKFNNLPLRILIPTPFVGAIIGKQGLTIKALTTKCRTRIDVHGKENIGFPEKMMSIYGQMENRSLACKEVLKMLEAEGAFLNRKEAVLKVLVHDSYCGRLIGKEGRSINKIKENSGTKIVFSNSHELATLYPDRVISIFGSIDGISLAETLLSMKLAHCIESDAKFSGALTVPGAIDYGQEAYNYALGYGLIFNQPVEMCQVCIPNSAVGPMIGAGGATIKGIMRDSMASLFVEPKPVNVEATPSLERIVTIKGSFCSCWKACYMIFEKMRSLGFCGIDEAHLKTIMMVPSAFVGKLIGKSGKNIRDVQKASGAIVRLPTDSDTKNSRCNSDNEAYAPHPCLEVPVEISGNFQSVQNAHLIVKALMRSCDRRSSRPPWNTQAH